MEKPAPQLAHRAPQTGGQKSDFFLIYQFSLMMMRSVSFEFSFQWILTKGWVMQLCAPRYFVQHDSLLSEILRSHAILVYFLGFSSNFFLHQLQQK